MINLHIETDGKCKNCPYMELNIEEHNLSTGVKFAVRALSVKCEHESLCYHIEQYLKDFQEQEKKRCAG